MKSFFLSITLWMAILLAACDSSEIRIYTIYNRTDYEISWDEVILPPQSSKTYRTGGIGGMRHSLDQITGRTEEGFIRPFDGLIPLNEMTLKFTEPKSAKILCYNYIKILNTYGGKGVYDENRYTLETISSRPPYEYRITFSFLPEDITLLEECPSKETPPPTPAGTP